MDRRLAQVLLTTVGVAALSGALAAPATADPVNAKNAAVLSVECETLGTLEVATNGNGEWTPGLVTTNNQVGIPYRFHGEGTFTPVGGEPETFTEDSAKRAPRNGRLDVCTFSESGSDEFGSFEFHGTVWISYTPAR